MRCVRSARLVLASALLAAFTAGCGSRTVPVKGVVTCDGKPLAHASVLFIHQKPEGRDAHGFTDDNGAFRLSTFRSGDGAMPGSYKVTVHFSESVKVASNLRSAEAVQKAMVEASASHKPSLVLPAIYSQPDRTVLKHRVPEDGDVKLELRSETP